jgi:hypothetical protein
MKNGITVIMRNEETRMKNHVHMILRKLDHLLCPFCSVIPVVLHLMTDSKRNNLREREREREKTWMNGWDDGNTGSMRGAGEDPYPILSYVEFLIRTVQFNITVNICSWSLTIIHSYQKIIFYLFFLPTTLCETS